MALPILQLFDSTDELNDGIRIEQDQNGEQTSNEQNRWPITIQAIRHENDQDRQEDHQIGHYSLIFFNLGFIITVNIWSFPILIGFPEILPASHLAYMLPTSIGKELQIGFPVFGLEGLIIQPIDIFCRFPPAKLVKTRKCDLVEVVSFCSHF